MPDDCFLCLLEKKRTTPKVIDNPLSAVKELIDNSIKAQCSTVTLKLDASSGGYRFIQICDDGSGIAKSKRNLLFLKEEPTTRQGRSIRGKSLCKIGNVALKDGLIEVCTRCHPEKTAYQWYPTKCSTQNDIRFQRVVYPRGTRIIIRNLHEPKKESKIQSLELDTIQKIIDIMRHFSFVNQNISFNLDLVNLLEDGSVRLQKRFPPLLQYEDRYHQFTKIMRGIGNKSKFRCVNNLSCGKYFSVSVIFPDILTLENSFNKELNRYPSINNTIQAVDSKFGQRVIRFFSELYKDFDRPSPYCWFLGINCHHPQVKILFSEKGIMTSGINVESILLTLKHAILDLYKSGAFFDVDLSLGDEHRRLLNSFPDKIREDKFIVKCSEQDWVTDMCDYQDIGSQNIGHWGVMHEGSTDQSDGEIETDDLILSKNVSLSNPFILTRIRSRNVTAARKNSDIYSETTLDSLSKPNHSFTSIDHESVGNRVNKKQKLLESSFSFEGDSTTCVDIEESLHPIVPRNIQSFYEGTKDLKIYTKIEHKDYTIRNLFKTSYKKELIWCYRKGTPSLTLIDGIQEKMEELDSNVDIQLSLLDHGWFLIKI